MVGKFSENGELGGGKPTPEIHRGNLDRRSEPPDPRKGRSGSNHDKLQIPFLRYEDELVPGGRPAIRSLQKESTAIEICWQIEHPHTQYSSCDPLRSLQPPRKTYLKEAIHPSGRGGHDLPVPRQRSSQGGSSASCFPNNGRIMGKTG